jgi:hypothetical protein
VIAILVAVSGATAALQGPALVAELGDDATTLVARIGTLRWSGVWQ